MKREYNHVYHLGLAAHHITRIGIPPWITLKMDVDTMHRLDGLEQRCRVMGVNVSTHRRGSDKDILVRVVGDQGAVSLRAEGDVLAIIAGALDDYDTAYSGEGWSAEELIQVAVQSGIPVERG